MFGPGDVVVYRHHVCRVETVREKYFNEKDYLELHALFEKALKLYVVAEDALPPLVRPPMDQERAQSLLDAIPSIPPIDEEALKQASSTSTLLERKMREEYEALLKSANAEDLVTIVKATRRRTARREKAGRSIATIDRKYHDLAMGFLCNELCMSLDIDRDRMEEMVVEQLGDPEA